MFAVMVNALLIGLALASIALLADCGLRWWSAFGALRRELPANSALTGRIDVVAQHSCAEQGMRPAIVNGVYSRFGRMPTLRQPPRGRPTRVAA